MAIGLGRMFGFRFLENFDLPYISRSITEFWRRWHISLSSWFRDYVYIPLGGNRKGTLKTYRNLFIVFLLTGIWHGAAWNYIFWGLWHGMFMLLERAFRKPGGSKTGRVSGANAEIRRRDEPEAQLPKEDTMYANIKALIRHGYTLLVVLLGWVFFRAGSLSEGMWYLKTMFGRALGNTPGYSVMWYLDGWTAFVLVVGIVTSFGLHKAIVEKIESVYIRDIALIFLLLLSVMRIVSGTYNPFIYFQF